MNNTNNEGMAREIISTLTKKRKDLGLSEKDLSRLIEIKESEIIKIENFEISPSVGTIFLMADAVGLTFKLSKINNNSGNTCDKIEIPNVHHWTEGGFITKILYKDMQEIFDILITSNDLNLLDDDQDIIDIKNLVLIKYPLLDEEIILKFTDIDVANYYDNTNFKIVFKKTDKINIIKGKKLIIAVIKAWRESLELGNELDGYFMVGFKN